MRTIGRLLADTVDRSPGATHLIAGENAFSFVEVKRRGDAAASELRSCGVSRGDRIALLVRNEPRFLFTWFGAAVLGATIVPLDPNATTNEMTGFLQRAQPKLIVASADVAAEAETAALDLAPQVPVLTTDDMAPDRTVAPVEDAATPDDIALMLPTSGTTAKSKLVMLTHRGLVLAGEAFPWWIGLEASDRLLAALPLFHMNALAYSTLGSIARGSSLVLLPRFSASRFLDEARRFEATQFNAVGALLEILMRQPLRGDDARNPLRLCYAAPAPTTAERHVEIEKRFGLEITAGYALSETPFGTIWPRGERPYGSIGKPRQHPELGDINEVRVADPQGNDVPTGETGELLLRNPAVMAGYFALPEATEAALRDGWLRTGDLVRRNEDGVLFFVARSKEIIRRRGENVAPNEIEEAFMAHPSVVEAAVVAVPAEVGEEDIKGFLVAPEADVADIVASLRGRLSPHKIPRFIELVADLPRTPTGRVAKHLLPRARNKAERDLS